MLADVQAPGAWALADHECECARAHIFQILLKKPQQSGSAGLTGVSFVIAEAARAGTVAPSVLGASAAVEVKCRGGSGCEKWCLVPVPVPILHDSG